jgi:hypothetical protein
MSRYQSDGEWTATKEEGVDGQIIGDATFTTLCHFQAKVWNMVMCGVCGKIKMALKIHAFYVFPQMLQKI